MAFKHFRRHQKLYLIIGLGAMIFSLVTFSVGSTISALARSEESGAIGTFVDSFGETITITRDDYMRSRLASNEIFAPFYKTEQKDSVIEHIVLAHEVELAGIRVSDDMLAQAMTEAGLQISEAQYRDFVSRLGVTVKRFEDHFREMVGIRILRAMRQEGDLISSREVYDRFAEENQVVHVAYVAFPFADYAEGLDPDSITDEDLRAFYDEEMPASQKTRDFSTPEKFRFEVAYADFTLATLADVESFLGPDDEPSDEEIERTYQVNVNRYRTQAPAPESGSDSGQTTAGSDGAEAGGESDGQADSREETGGGDDSAGGANDGSEAGTGGGEDGGAAPRRESPVHGPRVGRLAAPADALFQDGDGGQDEGVGSGQEDPQGDQESGAGEADPEAADAGDGEPAEEASWRKMTLEEARPLIRKDILLKKLLEKLQADYTSQRADLQRQAAQEEATPDDGAEAAEETAADEQNAAELAAKLKGLFRDLAEKYHLTYASHDEGLTREEIETLDPIGDRNLQYLVASLQPNDIRVRAPLEEQLYGYVLRLSERIAPEARPFEEVRDSLVEPYVTFRQRQRAEEAARAFRDKVASLAREATADEVEKIRAEALRIAENRISANGIEDEDEKQKLRDQVVAGEQGRIDELVNGALADHVEDVAKSMSLTVERLEPFRKNFYFSAPYRRLSPGPAKYLASYEAGLSRAETGTVTDVLSDNEGECSYVAWVTDKTRPIPEEMGPGDRGRARSNVERTHFIARGLFARQKDPQAMKRLELEYQVRLKRKDDETG